MFLLLFRVCAVQVFLPAGAAVVEVHRPAAERGASLSLALSLSLSVCVYVSVSVCVCVCVSVCVSV